MRDAQPYSDRGRGGAAPVARRRRASYFLACVVLFCAAAAAPHRADPPDRWATTSPPPPPAAALFEDLGRAYAQLLLLVSVTGDELLTVAGDPAYETYDDGNILDPTPAQLASGYDALMIALWEIDEWGLVLIEAETTTPGSVDMCEFAALSNYAAIGHLIQAEFFGELPGNAPGSTVTGDALVTAYADSAIVDANRAIVASEAHGCTDTATPVGQLHDDRRLADALKARAHALKGDLPAAVTSAQLVPHDDWTFAFTFSASPHAPQVALTAASVAFGSDYSQTGAAGNQGLIDPVDLVARTRVADLRASLMADANPALPFVSGREMSLIRARAAIDAGDAGVAFDAVNIVRALEGRTAVTGATIAEARDAERHEWRAETFFRGRRLRALYDQGLQSPEWLVGSDAEASPPAFLPIPAGACAGVCPDRIDVAGRTTTTDGVILVDGKRSGFPFDSCFERELVDEVGGTGALAFNVRNEDNCASTITAYEIGDRLVYEPNVTGWTDQLGDVVTVTSGPAYEIPIKVWRRSTSDASDAVILDDVQGAEATFSKNRAGIALVHEVQTSSSVPADMTCDMRDQLRLAGTFTVGILNVYYVPTVSLPDGTHPLGLFCPDPTPGADALSDTTYIVIDADAKWATTFAHELGHALLRSPPQLWHPREASLTVVPESNLMSSYVLGSVETDYAIRDSLSLGQAFRMNVHETSWLNRAKEVDGSFQATTTDVRSGPERYCPCDWVTSDPCPPLGLHYDGSIVVNPGLPSAFYDDCFDRLLVNMATTVPTTGDAAALLDGYVPAEGGCANDVLSKSGWFQDALSGAWFHRLEFENVLDPAAGAGGSGCDAEVLFFSRHHRLFQATYDGSEFTLSGNPAITGLSEQTLEQHDLTSLLSPLHVVNVTVWPNQSVGTCTTFAASNLEQTTRDLFLQNRAGIHISMTCDSGMATGTTGPVCAPTGATTGQINVFWVASVPAGVPSAEPGGGVCPGGEIVYVVEGALVSPTEIAHQLGHALGLGDLQVGAAGFTDAGLTRNVMKRGLLADEELRDRFTLGQVARMYFHGDSFLRSSLGLADRCSAGPSGTCPELWIDVPR